MSNLPLTGRRVLLDAVSQRVEAGAHVVLRGPAGIGKTRLAAEVTTTDLLDGRAIDRILASHATTSFQLGALAPLGRPTGVAAGDLPALISWYLGRWRSQRRNNRPAILWLDDAQNVDDLSASVIRQAVALGSVQLIATHRTPEAFPSDLDGLVTEGQLEVVDVPPLDRVMTKNLAEAAAGRPLTASQLDRLHGLAAGFPLYVRDLALALGDSDETPNINDLAEALGARFAGMSQDERRTAELVAAAEPVDLALFTDRSETVTALIDKGLLRRQDASQVRLEHPLYGAWLLESLGPLVKQLFADLADRANALGTDERVDAVQELDWRLKAGDEPTDVLVAQAARLAIERSDGGTALRFTRARPGFDLLRGQALLITGDFGNGVALLQSVHRGPLRDERVEAAFWLARLIGVGLGDQVAAHQILDDVQDDATNDDLKRLLLDARLWLWFFGEAETNIRDVVLPLLDTEPSHLTYEIALKAAHLIYQSEGPARSEDVLAQMGRIEQTIVPTGAVFHRAEMVKGWGDIFAARFEAGLARLQSLFSESKGDDLDPDMSAMLGSTTAYALSLAGHIGRAQDFARFGSQRTSDGDGLRFGLMAELIGAGVDVLAGKTLTTSYSLDDVPTSGAGTLDLETALTVRISVLLSQRAGRPSPDDDVRRAIAAHAKNRKYSWIGVFMAELADRGMGAAVHRDAVETLSLLEGPGVHQITKRGAQARIDGRHDRLLDVATEYESIGFAPAASRAFADVAVLEPADSPLRPAAIQGVIRSLRHWDGGPTWWTAEIDGLPTSRQQQIMWQVVDGQRPPDIARQFGLSTRTVENHLYRVYKALGVSGQEELVAVMSG